MEKVILLVSTELSEIFALSDRIAVLYKGRIMGIYRNGEISTDRIGLLMAGVGEKESQMDKREERKKLSFTNYAKYFLMYFFWTTLAIILGLVASFIFLPLLGVNPFMPFP